MFGGVIMGVFADFQNQAVNPTQFQLGKPIGQLMDGNTSAGIATAPLPIAGAAYVTDNNMLNSSIAPNGAGGGYFAGIIWSANESEMQWSDVQQGYSQVVAAGRLASYITRGTVPVNVTNTASPVIGDAVWVNTTTGVFQTQAVGGTAISGCTITNFRVMQVPAGWVTATPSMVVISNLKNVGA